MMVRLPKFRFRYHFRIIIGRGFGATEDHHFGNFFGLLALWTYGTGLFRRSILVKGVRERFRMASRPRQPS